MRSLLLLLVLALLVGAGACATAQSAERALPRHHHHHRHHRAAAPSPGAVARAEAEDEDDGDDDAGDDARAQQELTAPIVTEGRASYYHDSLAGRMTANGEKYNPEKATCAHRSLPFGTVLVIEDVATGKRSHCRVNDRGPYVDGRLLDVSRRVARDLHMLNRGVIRVRIRVVRLPTTS